MIAFWAFHLLMFCGALFLRTTAPITLPVAVSHPSYGGELTPSNVCATLNAQLLSLSRASVSDLSVFDAQVAHLDEYLQIVLLRLADIRYSALSPKLVADIRALRTLSEHYVLKKSPALSPEDMQHEFADFRNRFHDTLFHRVSRPIPTGYLHLVRASAGLTEGLGAPVVLLWRTASAAIAGKISVRNILNPGTWQRRGPFFFGFLFYGSLLCTYLCAELSLRTKHHIFYVPGILAVLYSTGHLLVAILFAF